MGNHLSRDIANKIVGSGALRNGSGIRTEIHRSVSRGDKGWPLIGLRHEFLGFGRSKKKTTPRFGNMAHKRTA